VTSGTYPEASLDQATEETVCALKEPGRLAGMSEQELETDCRWTKEMARLCLTEPGLTRQQRVRGIEFQRHAGRIARFRGEIELALEEYARAWDMTVELACSGPGEFGGTVIHDFADTYFDAGAYELSKDIHEWCNARSIAAGKAPPEGSGYHLEGLANIAQRQGRYTDAVRLQEAAEHTRQPLARGFLKQHPELKQIDRDASWPEIVRRPETQRAFAGLDTEGRHKLCGLRDAYWHLARTYRQAGLLDEAEYALETAALTPWVPFGTYRRNLDLPVDRERAHLALARGRAEEALEKADECLEKYEAILGQAEKVELHELASRALEQMSDLAGALKRLERAVTIVEDRRSKLVSDDLKQAYVSSYADLYRRATELSVRLGRPISETFRWAERAKARAMLDHVLRSDYRTAREIELGNAEAKRAVGDLAGDVIGLAELRKAEWFGDDVALLEYVLGREWAYLWLVTRREARQYRLPYGVPRIERAAGRLREALKPGRPLDDAWVEPARRLYEALIESAEPELRKLRDVTRLVVVGDGALRTIPFEVLVTDPAGVPRRAHLPQRLLIEDYAISYAPSASLVHEISRRLTPASWKYDFWGIACSRFDKAKAPRLAVASASTRDRVAMILRSGHELTGLRDLPMAPYEVGNIAAGFGRDRCRTFVDDGWVKARLLKADAAGELGRVRFLHFATHTVFDANSPFKCGLVLAPTPDEPEPTASQPGEGADGLALSDNRLRALLGLDEEGRSSRSDLLTLREIASLKLNSELVVLSACASLGGESAYGDWLAGLTRSFLLAGARGTVCTLWELGDNEALMLMSDMYRVLRERHASPERASVARVLQTVKTSCLPSPSDYHPAVWSGFVYYGLPGSVALSASPATLGSPGSSTP
jgi:CHAT domain-containing protein